MEAVVELTVDNLTRMRLLDMAASKTDGNPAMQVWKRSITGKVSAHRGLLTSQKWNDPYVFDNINVEQELFDVPGSKPLLESIYAVDIEKYRSTGIVSFFINLWHRIEL